MDLKQLSDDELKKLYTDLRSEHDAEDNLSDVYKILLNSYYGAGALSSNPFSSGKLTNASVTISGRCMNKMMGLGMNTWINNKLGKETGLELSEIIQGDTDSNYLTLDKLIPISAPTEKALPIIQSIVADHLEPNIVETIDKFCELFNVRDRGVLAAENEVISKGFVSVASKRYYTRVLVKDGTLLKEPKIKITGISLKGKSTPELAKNKLEPILDIILDEDEIALKEYIKNTQEAFIEADIKDIARNVKVNSLDYKRDGEKFKRFDGTKFLTAPINSHASLIYNEYVKEKQLGSSFNKIEPSDSINYVYLLQPNKFYSKAIAFKDPKFSQEIGHDNIDIGTHFEKDFKDKVRIITNAIGWDIDSTTASLEDW